ncbi:MAG TPA: protein phosphatase 2C domain-containing protein [Blastocatellia bacterium]|nr:protein phosphatase 2C domain-containing protein [Blastocatellia bacterium]
MKITVGQVTDKGLNPKRLSNEDNLLAMPERGLFLVADGVGGRLGGGIASQIVVDVFSKVFAQRHQEDLRNIVEKTIDLCNQKIYEDARSNPDLDGMATTIAVLAVDGKRAIVAHVGDSRVYRFDRKGLICLTEDHSEVSEALRAGLITAEQAAQHPRRNVISRALGAEIEVEPDFREIEVDDRTSFVICSDGVTRHVTDQEIARLMKHEQRPELICERLKQLCYQGGAEDNLTAIVVDFGPRSYAEEPTKPRIPAKAARAQVASKQTGGQTGAQAGGQSGAQPGPTPRQSNRIEVNLKVAQPPSNPTENKNAATAKERAQGKGQGIATGNNPTLQRKGAAKLQPGSRSEPQTELRLAADKLKESKPRALNKRGDRTTLKGEMSKLMKMSLLFITLVIGAVIGFLLYGYTPLKGIVNNLIGNIDPYEKRRIQYRPTNAEINSAYARHLEGFSDEARARIGALLTANPSNDEALYYLGRIDLDQKKYDDAVNRLNQAAKLNANLPDVWAYLAAAYLGMGQSRNAQEALRNLSAPPSSAPGASPQTSPTPAG